MGDDLIRREKYLNNCKPAMIQSRKSGSNINANKRLKLQAEADKIRTLLGLGQPAEYAGAYATKFAA